MTDRIQHARDWLAAQLQQEAEMTPGMWFAQESDGLDGRRYTYVGCDNHDGTSDICGVSETVTTADCIGIAAARNQWRALLLIADEELAWHDERRIAWTKPPYRDMPQSRHCELEHENAISRILSRLREAGYSEAHDAS